MPININVCGTQSQGLPSAHSHLLTLAAQGRGSCVVSLTVHTKRPLFLCPEHLQFPGKELHRLLDTLALSHRHLGHTGKQNKSAMSRAHVLWLSHSFQTGHSPTALGVTLDNINSDPCPSNLRRGPQSARVPLRGRAQVSSVSHVDIKLSTTFPGKTRVPTFCKILGGTHCTDPVSLSCSMNVMVYAANLRESTITGYLLETGSHNHTAQADLTLLATLLS